MMKHLIAIIAFFLFSFSVHAAEYRRIGQDFRSLAMGNTGIATATSSNALFYNPAALGNIQNWWFELPTIQVTASEDGMDLYKVTQGGEFKLEDQDDQFEFMGDYIGKNLFVKIDAGANIFLNLNKKGTTIGTNYNYEALLDLSIRNPSMPQIDGLLRLDHIRQVGVSTPVGVGQWVIGATSKNVQRTELQFSYSMQDAIDKVEFPTLGSDGTEGKGVGYDVGFIFRQASKYRLMIGGVYRQAIELGTATPIPEEIALGFGMFHDFGAVRWTGALDFRDLTFKGGQEGDRSINRRTHIGMEFGFIPLTKNTSMITLRSGFNQSHYSTGAELSLGHALVLGYAKYYEETGEYAGQKGTQRTAAYIALGF